MRRIAGAPPHGTPVPAVVSRLAGAHPSEPVWLNLDGGLTVRFSDRYVKWVPAGQSLAAERERLEWAAGFHPVPEVLDHGSDDDGEWMLTRAIEAASAASLTHDPRTAAVALGEGLRALHENLPIDACPFSWSAISRGGVDAPPVDRLVVAHGDACLPNTLLAESGAWVAHVDLGSLGVADRWADLAVASMSLDWNLGEGWQGEFFSAYGLARDEERILFYRDLWDTPA